MLFEHALRIGVTQKVKIQKRGFKKEKNFRTSEYFVKKNPRLGFQPHVIQEVDFVLRHRFDDLLIASGIQYNFATKAIVVRGFYKVFQDICSGPHIQFAVSFIRPDVVSTSVYLWAPTSMWLNLQICKFDHLIMWASQGYY